MVKDGSSVWVTRSGAEKVWYSAWMRIWVDSPWFICSASMLRNSMAAFRGPGMGRECGSSFVPGVTVMIESVLRMSPTR